MRAETRRVKRALGPLTYWQQALSTGIAVGLRILADGAVIPYLVDRRNLNRLEADQRFQSHGPGPLMNYRGKFGLPHAGPWWLIVENPSENIIDVEIEVSIF